MSATLDKGRKGKNRVLVENPFEARGVTLPPPLLHASLITT